MPFRRCCSSVWTTSIRSSDPPEDNTELSFRTTFRGVSAVPSGMDRHKLRPLLLASAFLMFGVGWYFFTRGNQALGAALVALGIMELAVSLVLTRRQ